MKKFAIFLPQFHEIKENNKWWGEGFTEWTNVKNARPLYKCHSQPKIPLNNNFYNLLDKETVKWQTDLALQYGIDGFVYYHYYFEGRLIMEKPAENLLGWKDIHQKYFFCWANHTWLKGSKGKREILIKQTYGGREQWKKHMDYLVPFFKDDRYEKKNNKPLFMIYVNDFIEKKEMVDYFNDRCIEEGFDGIYIVETYNGDMSPNDIEHFKTTLTKHSELVYFREPNVSTRIYYKHFPIARLFHKLLREYDVLECFVAKINGDILYEYMIKNAKRRFDNFKIAHGIFFEWDNTPRHKNHGYIITPPDKNIFDKYIKRIISDEYVFINAWNEWAEGMMLEPTETDGLKYLEWIKSIE